MQLCSGFHLNSVPTRPFVGPLSLQPYASFDSRLTKAIFKANRYSFHADVGLAVCSNGGHAGRVIEVDEFFFDQAFHE